MSWVSAIAGGLSGSSDKAAPVLRVGEEWDGQASGVETITIMAVADDRAKAGGRGRVRLPHWDVGSRTGQKRRGEIAEAMFLAKLAAMGYSVATPWGDSDRYDLIVDTGRRLLRVQVKSAHRVSANAGGGYHIRAHGHARKAYRASEIDLLVACVVPEEVWYIFPPAAFQKMKSMRLFPRPGRKGSKFERYREAWRLLRDGR